MTEPRPPPPHLSDPPFVSCRSAGLFFLAAGHFAVAGRSGEGVTGAWWGPLPCPLVANARCDPREPDLDLLVIPVTLLDVGRSACILVPLPTEPPRPPMPSPAPCCLGPTWGKAENRGLAQCREKQPPPEGTVTLAWLGPGGPRRPLPPQGGELSETHFSSCLTRPRRSIVHAAGCHVEASRPPAGPPPSVGQ